MLTLYTARVLKLLQRSRIWTQLTTRCSSYEGDQKYTNAPPAALGIYRLADPRELAQVCMGVFSPQTPAGRDPAEIGPLGMESPSNVWAAMNFNGGVDIYSSPNCWVKSTYGSIDGEPSRMVTAYIATDGMVYIHIEWEQVMASWVPQGDQKTAAVPQFCGDGDQRAACIGCRPIDGDTTADEPGCPNQKEWLDAMPLGSVALLSHDGSDKKMLGDVTLIVRLTDQLAEVHMPKDMWFTASQPCAVGQAFTPTCAIIRDGLGEGFWLVGNGGQDKQKANLVKLFDFGGN